MPSHYWYHCTQCDYRRFRYRNVRRCPDCGESLVREEPLPGSEQQDGGRHQDTQTSPAHGATTSGNH
jgi:hypothetical protein